MSRGQRTNRKPVRKKLKEKAKAKPVSATNVAGVSLATVLVIGAKAFGVDVTSEEMRDLIGQVATITVGAGLLVATIRALWERQHPD